jgi:hypothetical protein
LAFLKYIHNTHKEEEKGKLNLFSKNDSKTNDLGIKVYRRI